MPIRTTTVDRQRTLAGLAKATFDTGNRPEAVEKAVEALLRANPQLTRDSALKSGMTLFVPRIRDMPPAAGKTRAHDDIVALLSQRAKAFEQFAGKPLDQAIAAAEERVKDTLSPDTAKAIVGARPDLKDKIKVMQEGAKKEAERVKTSTERIRTTIAEVVRDIEKPTRGS
jgi:gas vesicle protein